MLKEGLRSFLYDYSLLSFWGCGTKSLWFIAFILLMYLIFPFFYHWLDGGEKERIIKLILLVLVLHCGFQGIKYCMPGFYGNAEIALLRIYSFLLGVFCAKYIYEKKDGGIWMYLLIGVGLVAKIISLAFRDSIPVEFLNKRIVMCLFSVSLLFIIAKCLDLIDHRKLNQWLGQAGAYSLELYMTHVSIRHIMNRIGMHTYKMENYLICLLLSILCSVLLQKLISGMTNKHIHGKID